MKRMMFYGLSTAAMLLVTPQASAGYWTGHAEIIKELIENWILDHYGARQAPGAVRQDAVPGSSRAALPPATSRPGGGERPQNRR